MRWIYKEVIKLLKTDYKSKIDNILSTDTDEDIKNFCRKVHSIKNKNFKKRKKKS